MTILYNCKRALGDAYRITKFDRDFNPESSYLCTTTVCECPAGHRPKCRHREMLPKFIQRNATDTEWFYDYDRGGWVQMAQEPSPELASEPLVEPSGPTMPASTSPSPSSDILADLPANHSARSGDVIGRVTGHRFSEPSPSPTIRRRV